MAKANEKKWTPAENKLVSDNRELTPAQIKEKFFREDPVTVTAIACKKSRITRVEFEMTRQKRARLAGK
jgi:hypothetical protein